MIDPIIDELQKKMENFKGQFLYRNIREDND